MPGKVVEVQLRLEDGGIVTGRVKECNFTRRHTIAPIFSEFTWSMRGDGYWDIFVQMGQLDVQPGKSMQRLPALQPEGRTVQLKVVEAIDAGCLRYEEGEALLRAVITKKVSLEVARRCIEQLVAARDGIVELLDGKTPQSEPLSSNMDLRRFRALELKED